MTLTYGDANHVHAVTSVSDQLSGNSYQYDQNGNQTTRTIGQDTFNLLYDAENRLVEVTKNGATIAQFVYDGDGKRVKSVINGETTLFVGNYFEQKGSQMTKYYFAGTTRIAMRKYVIPQNMTVEYLFGDHLGSTSLTTDTNGALISEIRYKPWGEVRYTWTNAPANTSPAYELVKYQYTGQYSYDVEFGLMFFNARWYDPYLNQFTQPDTIVSDPYNPQAWNRYAYALNNPIRYNDPTGHCPGIKPGQKCAANPKVTAPPRLPAWWNPYGTSHIYIDGQGYFDTGHIGRGWRSAQFFIGEIEQALSRGGGEFDNPGTSGGSNYIVNYSVSANVTDDQIPTIAYGIYTDFEIGYEEHQAKHFNPSAFSPEDLPSDHLGFWAYMNGLELDDIPSVLESLGEVTPLGDIGGSLVVDIFSDGIHIGYSYPRNYEFSPMITETIRYGGGAYATQTRNVAWPSWLEIVPIPSGPNTWQRLR